MKITKRQPRRIILENDRREELISVVYDIMVDNRTDDQEEDFLAAKEEMALDGEATDDELRGIQLGDILQMGGSLTMEQKTMKITKRHLRALIQEMAGAPLEPSAQNPNVQVILDQMEEMSIDDLRVIWQAAADTTKRKQNELKAGFKKGDKVKWTRKNGSLGVGTVVRRGGKYVMVQPDGSNQTWKKWPSSLSKI